MRCCGVFPRRSSLIYKAAELNWRNGYLAQATDLVGIGLNGVADETMRAKFEELQRELPK